MGEESKRKWKRPPWYVWLAIVLTLSGIPLVLGFKILNVVSAAMMPTLDIDDSILISKFTGDPDPGDLIVYAFRKPGHNNDGDSFVKRVIATAGQRIRIVDNVIHIDGQPIPTHVVREGECKVYVDPEGKDETTCPCVEQEETLGETTYRTQHFVAGTRGPFCTNTPAWPPDRASMDYRNPASQPTWRPQMDGGLDVVVPEGKIFVVGDNRDRSQDSRYTGWVSLDDVQGTVISTW